MVLTPSQRGAAAEAHIAAAAVSKGIFVGRPICDGGRYDLMFDVGDCVLRVQCKSAHRTGDVLVIGLRTNRSTPRGYVTGSYKSTEIDLVAAYEAESGKCYVIPASEVDGKTTLYLRLTPTRNNQALNVKWARDHEFGAIAQLGERRAGSAKVAGSIPASSI